MNRTLRSLAASVTAWLEPRDRRPERRDGRRSLVVLAAAAAVLPAACAALPPANLRSPEIAVADLALVDFGLDRLRLRAVLDTENPNDVVVPLTDIRMDLMVFGVALAQGFVVDRRVDLPARGRIAVPVEFTVPIGRLLDVVDRFRARGWEQFDYRLTGTANWGETPFPVPFERSGNLELLKRLPGILGAR
ncbi:MAG: LEA type 2 family protein [Lautropia sp.]